MPTQRKLPGLDPGRQTTTTAPSEAAIQAMIEQGLGYLGYIVLHTQHVYRWQPCPACGRKIRPSGGYGADQAIPDLLVSHPAWTVALWIGLEIKGKHTPISPEQQQLAARGRIVIGPRWQQGSCARQACRCGRMPWRADAIPIWCGEGEKPNFYPSFTQPLPGFYPVSARYLKRIPAGGKHSFFIDKMNPGFFCLSMIQ